MCMEKHLELSYSSKFTCTGIDGADFRLSGVEY